MMMKYLLLSVLSFLTLNFGFSQAPNLQIIGEKEESEYGPLLRAIPISDTTNAWFELDWSMTLSDTLTLVGDERLSLTELSVAQEGGLFIELEGKDVLLTLVPLILLDTTDFIGYSYISTFFDPENRGNVFYTYEEEILQLEFTNVTAAQFLAFGLRPLNFRFNFQVHIDIEEGTVTYHYGEISSVDESVEIPENVIIVSSILLDYEGDDGDFFASSFVSGDSGDPIFVETPSQNEPIPHLDSLPFADSKYIFRFEEVTTSVPENLSNRRGEPLSLFPNPGSDQLIIEYPGLEFDYEIRSATGQLMDAGTGSRRTQVMAGGWPAGTYFVTVGTKGQSVKKVWMKVN
jgi:hypothetical protein